MDDAAKEVIETVASTTSTMLVKASKEDVSEFQAYTIRMVNEVLFTTPDIEQYKLFSVEEDLLDNRQHFLDLLCFPVLFPSVLFVASSVAAEVWF